MVGLTGASGYRSAPERSRARAAALFATTLFSLLVASLITAGPVSAREGIACDQYACTGEDPGFYNSAPRAGTGGGVEASPAPLAVAESGASHNVRLDPAEPGTLAGYGSNEGSEQGATAVYPAAEPTGDAVRSGEEFAWGDSSEESAAPRASSGDNGDLRSDPTGSTGMPLPGYAYAGEACEESHCGLTAVEGTPSSTCAAYRTESGRGIYGCTDPEAFDEKGCYEVTFYTKTGEPYQNLDTCSGERPYAPPEPPPDEFAYFDPPDEPYSEAGWEGHIKDQCYFDERGSWVEPPGGEPDPHCGLEDLPKAWECEVYYGTVHGTVRGCREASVPSNAQRLCSSPVHLYDEAGREIGTALPCPKVRTEACAEKQCGAPAPASWTCRQENWNFGSLYGGETRTITRCASPRFYEYVNGERPPCKKGDARYIAAIYDERGERVDGMTCLPGGTGGDLGEWVGLEAEQADDALNEPKGPTSDSPGRSGTLADSGDPSESSDAPIIPATGLAPEESSLPVPPPLATPVEEVAGGATHRSAAPVAGFEEFRSEPGSGAHATGGISSVDGLITGGRPDDENPFAERREESLAAPASGEREPDRAGEAPSSESPRGCVSGERDTPCESSDPAAGLSSGALRSGGERVETSPATPASRSNAREWVEGLIPLAGLAAVGGLFTLRRRFLA